MKNSYSEIQKTLLIDNILSYSAEYSMEALYKMSTEELYELNDNLSMRNLSK